MTTDFLVNTVLFEISKKSGFGQNLNITFESKNEWNAHINLWLSPFFYAHGVKGREHSWQENDFSELYLVEKDPCFFEWKEISFTYSDRLQSYIINLKNNENYEPHRSHYSGHLFIGWRRLVNE